MTADSPHLSTDAGPSCPPEVKDWILTQAFTRLQQRQYIDSLTLLRGLAVLTPQDADVFGMLSYVLLMADLPEECIQAAEHYLQCIPPDTDTKEIEWIRGRAHVRLEKASADGS